MPDKMQYRIDLKYIGAAFVGWQTQPDGGSVQDHLEDVLEKVLAENIKVIGASRTDSGVHAENQVASFCSGKPIDCGKLRASLNALLPDSIGVEGISPVPESFHAIRSARAKIYCYQIWNAPYRNPFLSPFSWQITSRLDLVAMSEASQHFVGFHNFSAFCASDSTAKTKERRVIEVKIQSFPNGLVQCWFVGEGFLKQMVRSIVGTLVEVGLGKREVNSIPQLIADKDRSKSGKTAPAQGLCLQRVVYESLSESSLLELYLKC